MYPEQKNYEEGDALEKSQKQSLRDLLPQSPHVRAQENTSRKSWQAKLFIIKQDSTPSSSMHGSSGCGHRTIKSNIYSHLKKTKLFAGKQAFAARV